MKDGFPCGHTTETETGGFTLIELLVVLAIISILASLILPAVGKARSSALGIASTSNLKQVYLMLDTYASDNRWYPRAYETSPTTIFAG